MRDYIQLLKIIKKKWKNYNKRSKNKIKYKELINKRKINKLRQINN